MSVTDIFEFGYIVGLVRISSKMSVRVIKNDTDISGGMIMI